MNHVHKISMFAVLLLSSGFLMAQGSIKRSSLSTSVSGAHFIQNGNFKVQQSIGHMGIMGLRRQQNHTVLRGFLLPQFATSTKQVISDFDCLVYPNPFDTYVNIDFDAPVSGDMIVRIHDVVGQLIMEKELVAKKQQRISLGHLAQAEYILNVQVMGKTFSQVLLNYKKLKKED